MFEEGRAPPELSYQTSHLLTGFMGDPLLHWNACANECELLSVPMTLLVRLVSVQTELRLVDQEFT